MTDLNLLSLDMNKIYPEDNDSYLVMMKSYVDRVNFISKVKNLYNK